MVQQAKVAGAGETNGDGLKRRTNEEPVTPLSRKTPAVKQSDALFRGFEDEPSLFAAQQLVRQDASHSDAQAGIRDLNQSR